MRNLAPIACATAAMLAATTAIPGMAAAASCPAGPYVLIDASRGGGVWWFSANGQPHQGQVVVDALVARGDTVLEMQPDAPLDTAQLECADLLVVVSNPYGGAPFAAPYKQWVGKGGSTLVLSDGLDGQQVDPYAAAFGLFPTGGSTAGRSVVSFEQTAILSIAGPQTWIHGSCLNAVPPGAVVLARHMPLGCGSAAAPVAAAWLPYGAGEVLWLGDTNILQSIDGAVLRDAVFDHFGV